jgi:hypothetical protein
MTSLVPPAGGLRATRPGPVRRETVEQAPRDYLPVPAAASPRGSVVRRITKTELAERGAAIGVLAAAAPTKGANLMIATRPDLPLTVHLIGTEHGLRLTQIRAWRTVVRYLGSQPFTHVFAETSSPSEPDLPPLADLLRALEDKIARSADLDAAVGNKESRPTQFRLKHQIDQLDRDVSKIDQVALDDAYATVAMKLSPGKPQRAMLDKDNTRALAAAANTDPRTPEHERVRTALSEPQDADEKAKRRRELYRGTIDIAEGNQHAIFAGDAAEKAQGVDLASAEERNRIWMDSTVPVMHPGENHLWIVGAAHLPGLALRFSRLGWKVDHVPVPETHPRTARPIEEPTEEVSAPILL